MSETALTLIKAALRGIGVIASGETPKSNETADALDALQFMLRDWSAQNMMIYYQTQDTITMDGSTYYTIGSGGDCDTTWPVTIKGATLDSDRVLRVIDESRYRRLSVSGISGDARYIWYNPEYPLGKLYPFPTGGTTMLLDSLKALSEPSGLTTTVQFPTPYDSAIKWNLMVELAPEYGVPLSPLIERKAYESKRMLENMNFAAQVNAAIVDTIKSDYSYDIDEA